MEKIFRPLAITIMSIVLLSTPLAVVITNNAIAAQSAETTAQKPGVNAPISASKVLEKIAATGYMGLSELDLEDNVYKADVVANNGDTLKIKINADSGELMGPKVTPNRYSMLDIAKKVEDAGYKITQIKADGEKYKVKVIDKDGKKTSLKVSAMTGEISKKWFD